MNTDLQATFKLILDQAVKHNVPVSEMPTKVLILSDMEFDSGNLVETGRACQIGTQLHKK